MTPKKNQDWTPEPFPEPRTIPEGWNAAAFSQKRAVPEQNDPSDDWKPEAFPEPRFFPWTSGR
jgi:hypothetical protein